MGWSFLPLVSLLPAWWSGGTTPSPVSRPDSFASTLGWALLFLINSGKRSELASRVRGARIRPVPAIEASPMFFFTEESPPPLILPPSSDRPPIRVLSLDGGGIRGRNLMVMIEAIEAETGVPIAEQFDLIAGTSIGGCGALVRAQPAPLVYSLNRRSAIAQFDYPKPVDKAREAMVQLQTTCFANASKRRLFSEGHVCADHRRVFVDDICGKDAQLACDRGPHAFALASRRGPRGVLEPFVFRSYALRDAELAGTHRARLCDAIEATSAAPFMFPRCKTSLDDGKKVRVHSLADGGMLANDPTLIALQEARAIWPSHPIGLVVSLGTGDASPVEHFDYDDASGTHIKLHRASVLESLDIHVDAVSDASKPLDYEPVEALIGRLWSKLGRDQPEVDQELSRLMQIGEQPPCENVSPIETNEATLIEMEQKTNEFVAKSSAMKLLCDLLVAMRSHDANVNSR
ncbi:MAG: hypothetical protein SGPRY_011310, partial [Prymnesium sp.]